MLPFAECTFIPSVGQRLLGEWTGCCVGLRKAVPKYCPCWSFLPPAHSPSQVVPAWTGCCVGLRKAVPKYCPCWSFLLPAHSPSQVVPAWAGCCVGLRKAVPKCFRDSYAELDVHRLSLVDLSDTLIRMDFLFPSDGTFCKINEEHLS